MELSSRRRPEPDIPVIVEGGCSAPTDGFETIAVDASAIRSFARFGAGEMSRQRVERSARACRASVTLAHAISLRRRIHASAAARTDSARARSRVAL